MKQSLFSKLALVAACALVGGLFLVPSTAAEKKDVIKEAMKLYHKAPEGTDPTCKKAVDGKASADEIKKLVEAYKEMAKATPPKGEAASWKEKTTKLLAAAEGLSKGGPEASAKYKEAVNCKACHTAHKPD